jgi:DNA-binding transcriptional LysR family regulator
MLLNELELFYHVVKLKSFSKAALALGVSKSFVSKRVTALEQSLQSRLLTRTTRQVIPTEAGVAFYHQCEKIMEEAEKGYSIVNELQGKPSGKIKISCPPAFAMHQLVKKIPDFCYQYPEISLDLVLENRLVKIIEEGYDLVLRSTILEDSNLIAKPIATMKQVFVASALYLKNRDLPKSLEDLDTHDIVGYRDQRNPNNLTLLKEQKTIKIPIHYKITTNHLDVIKQWVVMGVCIAMLPDFMVNEEISHGTLIPCLTQYTFPTNTLYVIYPERDFIAPKTRAFLDFLQVALEPETSKL